MTLTKSELKAMLQAQDDGWQLELPENYTLIDDSDNDDPVKPAVRAVDNSAA